MSLSKPTVAWRGSQWAGSSVIRPGREDRQQCWLQPLCPVGAGGCAAGQRHSMDPVVFLMGFLSAVPASCSGELFSWGPAFCKGCLMSTCEHPPLVLSLWWSCLRWEGGWSWVTLWASAASLLPTAPTCVLTCSLWGEFRKATFALVYPK